MQNILQLRNSNDLEKYELEIEKPDTLESTELHKCYTKLLDYWINVLPGLHTPRNRDGTGGSPPRPYQLNHACVGLQREVNFYSHSMGCGKTLTTILHIFGWYGHDLFRGFDLDNLAKTIEEANDQLYGHRTKLRPGVIHIVAPKHILKQVWMRELARVQLAGFAEIIESEDQIRKSRAPIFIYHFDFLKQQTRKGLALRKAKTGLRLNTKGSTYFVGHQMYKLLAKSRPPNLLVVDEIHRLREGTERTRVMTHLRACAHRVIGLTGTPMDGWVSQSATLFQFLYKKNSKAFPYTVDRFSNRFTKLKAVTTDVVTGRETVGRERPVPGINNLQIPAFIHATEHLMHRLLLSDAEVKANVVYPEANMNVVKVIPDPEHQVFYQNIHKLVAQDAHAIQTTSRFKLRQNMLMLMNKLRLASSIPWYLGYELDDSALVRAVVDIVTRYQKEGRKGIIGTTFIQESRIIHDLLRKAGLNGIRLYADDDKASKKHLTYNDREELLESFIDDPTCSYLISNKELVAEGLNLSEVASYTVSCSNGFRAIVESQWLARIVRPGQLYPVVDCYSLINDDTVDVYVHQLLQAKIKATAGMIDLDFSYDQDTLTIDPLQLAELLGISLME